MNNFDRYYGKSENELSESMKELVFKKVVRGFDSTLDQLEEEKINLEKIALDLRVSIANGDTESIILLGQSLTERIDLDLLINSLKAEQKDFVE